MKDKMICSSDNGFTLLEVMITIVVMTVGILALYTMQLGSIRANVTSKNISLATNLITDQIEQLMGQAYDPDPVVAGDPRPLVDRTGDAENGLDDTTDVANLPEADIVLVNGIFTIYRNVAQDFPVPDVKTIRTIVQWQEGIIPKSITRDFVKMRKI